MKPILFNTDMVRAILDGCKSVTRRVVKPQPEGAHTILDCDEDEHTFDLLCGNSGAEGIFSEWCQAIKAPYWPGNILYVQETWAFDTGSPDDECGTGYFAYKADRQDSPTGRWNPSIHMPKEAARMFLRVTDVRVERLQDIEVEDISREGVFDACGGDDFIQGEAYAAFERVWNSTIKKSDLGRYGWDASPWVWVIEFERISREEALASERCA